MHMKRPSSSPIAQIALKAQKHHGGVFLGLKFDYLRTKFYNVNPFKFWNSACM